MMGKKVVSKRDVGGSMPHESPLVPNRKMKRMYEGIVESRLLEDLLRKRHKKAKRPSARGQEACRVSALIALDSDDLISDTSDGLETAFLRGVPLEKVVEHADAIASAKKKHAATAKLPLTGLLPATGDPADRFRLASGAALAVKRLKHAKPSRVVVLFATAREIKPSLWQKSLQFAAQEELPMLFVVLPEPAAKSSGKLTRPFELSARATAAGVPGIPVDASDAVALYRVAQESIGRARSGGGPALMECVHLIPKGSHKNASDPVVMMGQTLLKRQVCDKEWLASVSAAFKTRLSAL